MPSPTPVAIMLSMAMVGDHGPISMVKEWLRCEGHVGSLHLARP
jgi:hypothetical protein